MSKLALDLEHEQPELPSGWVSTTLGGLGLKLRPKIPADSTSDLPFIGMDNIDAGALEPNGHGRFGAMKSAAAAFQPGDVIYGRLRPYLNKVWVADFSGTASAEFIVFEKSEAIHPQLLAYLLHQQTFVNYASSKASGDRPRVDFNALKDYPVCLPPPAEQRRLAAQIVSLFAQIAEGEEKLRDARTRLDAYRKSVLKAAFTGALTDDWRARNAPTQTGADLLAGILDRRRDSWAAKGKKPASYAEPAEPVAELGELPLGWIWTSIGQLFSVAVGATPSRAKPELWNGAIPWVSSGEVAFNRIRQTEETIAAAAVSNLDTRVHPPGTVMIAMIGEGKTRGQCAILDIAAAHNQNCASIRVSETPIPPDFIYWCLFGRYARTREDGRGGNQPAMNSAIVKAIEIPLPPLAEIIEIVERIEAALVSSDKALEEIERQLTWAAALRQSVLAAAFSGRLSRWSSVEERQRPRPRESSDLPSEPADRVRGRRRR